MFYGPHVELTVKTDVVTMALLKLVIANIIQVVKDATRTGFLILVEVSAPKQEIDFVEPHFAWGRSAAKLLRGTRIAYVVTGRRIPLNATLIEDVAYN